MLPEILITAFTLQLLALPGEKGQFIISALSTKYNPLPVAIGASTAFGLWTVIEIFVGKELEDAFSESFVDGAMAVLLLLFAVLILYEVRTSDDDKDEQIEDNKYYKMVSDRVPNKLEGGVMAFIIMMFGEFGDKTQIITLSLAAKYGASWQIWAGEMLAIIPVTLANAFLVSKFTEKYNSKKLKYIAVILLVLFSIDIFLSQAIGFSILPL